MSLQLRSSYAIRLYQWAKRWEFRKNMEIFVQELRNVLGANNGQDGDGTKLNLAAYADFKRRAINPAIVEINAKTDLTISFRELKAKGSKAVERLAFSIRADSGAAGAGTASSPTPAGIRPGNSCRAPGTGSSIRGAVWIKRSAENSG